jgi:hypothetical protein
MCIRPVSEDSVEGVRWVSNATCVCNPYHGWRGADCTGLSTQSYVLVAISCVGALLALIALCLSVVVVRSVVRSGMRKWSNTTATLLLVLIALVALICQAVARVAIVLTPQYNRLKLPWSNTQRFHSFTVYEKVSIAVALFASMGAATSVSISWIDVARKSAKLLPANKSSAFADYSVPVYLTGFLMFAAIATGSALARQDLVVLFVVPFTWALIGVYIYAQHKLSQLLLAIGEIKESESGTASSSAAAASPSPAEEESSPARGRSSTRTRALGSFTGAVTGAMLSKVMRKNKMIESKNKYLGLLNKLRWTTRLVIAALTTLFSVGLAYACLSVFVGWRQVCDPSKTFCSVALLEELMLLQLIAVIIPVEWWLYQNAVNQGRSRGVTEATSFGDADSREAPVSTTPTTPQQQPGGRVSVQRHAEVAPFTGESL